MKTILLSRGYRALVDNVDFKRVGHLKWSAQISTKTVYAVRMQGPRCLLLHRVILGVVNNRKVEVDHKNGNGLDCRRKNIRICTRAQNCLNSQKRSGASSRFKGVSWDKVNNTWRVDIRVNGKRMNLGRYQSERKASRVYDTAAIKFFGKFARTNKDIEDMREDLCLA